MLRIYIHTKIIWYMFSASPDLIFNMSDFYVLRGAYYIKVVKLMKKCRESNNMLDLSQSAEPTCTANLL